MQTLEVNDWWVGGGMMYSWLHRLSESFMPFTGAGEASAAGEAFSDTTQSPIWYQEAGFVLNPKTLS